jgi:hypothetical protein
MKTRECEFTLIVDNPGDYASAEKAILDAGCDDVLMGVRYGCIFIDFSRESDSLMNAIFNAMAEVSQAGLCIRRVDSCNLLTQSEIAARIGRTRQLINQYVQGTRGPGNFPPPVCHIQDDQAPLWNWCEVAQWLFKNQMIAEESLNDAFVTDLINNSLDLKRQRNAAPELSKEIGNRVDLLDCGCSGSK